MRFNRGFIISRENLYPDSWVVLKMGLYKRGKVWWMSFVCKGKHYRKSTETEDRKLAQRIHDKVKGEIAEGKWFERLPGEGKLSRK
ncbi:MAG: hypothetical protein MUP41_14455 [Desulfobacterales bacterium]|nr:hypothetical protein [Desulfobacterales bacterium]